MERLLLGEAADALRSYIAVIARDDHYLLARGFGEYRQDSDAIAVTVGQSCIKGDAAGQEIGPHCFAEQRLQRWDRRVPFDEGGALTQPLNGEAIERPHFRC